MTSIFNGVNENYDTWHCAVHNLKSVSNIVNAYLTIYIMCTLWWGMGIF